jgi:hypothetical protein
MDAFMKEAIRDSTPLPVKVLLTMIRDRAGRRRAPEIL